MTFREQLDLVEYARMGERFTLYELMQELNATVESCGRGEYEDVTVEIWTSPLLYKAGMSRVGFLINDYALDHVVRCRQCGYMMSR